MMKRLITPVVGPVTQRFFRPSLAVIRPTTLKMEQQVLDERMKCCLDRIKNDDPSFGEDIEEQVHLSLDLLKTGRAPTPEESARLTFGTTLVRAYDDSASKEALTPLLSLHYQVQAHITHCNSSGSFGPSSPH